MSSVFIMIGCFESPRSRKLVSIASIFFSSLTVVALNSAPPMSFRSLCLCARGRRLVLGPGPRGKTALSQKNAGLQGVMMDSINSISRKILIEGICGI